jgi:tetratricopeptide (TPR) repeat protein
VIAGAPDPFDALPADAPPELVAIARHAMARSEAHRYESALELAEDLRAYLEGRVVTAHRTSWGLRARKWAARNPVAVRIGAAAALLLAVAGVGFWVVAGQRAREASRRTAKVIEFQSVPVYAIPDPFSGEYGAARIRNNLERNLIQLAEYDISFARTGEPLPEALAEAEPPQQDRVRRKLREMANAIWWDLASISRLGEGLDPEERVQFEQVGDWLVRTESSDFLRRWRPVYQLLVLEGSRESAGSFLESVNLDTLERANELEAYGDLAYLLGAGEEIVPAYLGALELDPRRFKPHVRLAMSPAEAVDHGRHLLNAVSLNASMPEVWGMFAQLLQGGQVDLRELVAAAFELAESDKPDSVADLIPGAADRALVDPTGIDLLLDQIRAGLTDLLAFVNLSALAVDQRTAEALPYVERGAELYPDDGRLLGNLGQMYDRLGEFDAARDAYTRCADIESPAQWLACINAGRAFHQLYIQRGMTEPELRETAREYYELALDLDPEHPFSQFNMAALLLAYDEPARWAESLDRLYDLHALGPHPQLASTLELIVDELSGEDWPEADALIDRAEDLLVRVRGE